MSNLPEGIYHDGECYRVKRLPRAYNRKRVGGKFATVEDAVTARNAAMGIESTPVQPFVPLSDWKHSPILSFSADTAKAAKAFEAAVLGMQGAFKPSAQYSGTAGAVYTTPKDLPAIPANVNLIEAPPLTLDCTRFIAASDFHAPLHSQEYTRRLLRVAQKHDVDSLIVQGDVFDFASSSRHPKTEQQASLNQTLRIGGDLLVALCGVFKHIYLLPGNHDRRVAGKLDEPLQFDMLVHAALRGRCVDQVTVTDYDYVYVGSEWVIGHPRYYSSTPAKGGADVALLQQRNVIGSHNHIFGVMQSKCGKFLSIDPGHMTDASITPYHLQSAGLSKYGSWRNGFVMVDSGVVKLFTDGLVDWGQYK